MKRNVPRVGNTDMDIGELNTVSKRKISTDDKMIDNVRCNC
jgi:hypothetical protein